MKKILAICLLVVLIALPVIAALTLSGCNYQAIDVTYNFDKAIIYLPDGTIVEGKIEGWTDFSDGDQLQIKIDGKTYLTHAENVVLIKE